MWAWLVSVWSMAPLPLSLLALLPIGVAGMVIYGWIWPDRHTSMPARVKNYAEPPVDLPGDYVFPVIEPPVVRVWGINVDDPGPVD